MATGKTTVAELVARQLAVSWTDMDARIEQQEGRSIAAIFETNGEAYFRQVEHRVLVEVCGQRQLGVVACGGGVVLNPDNIRLMKDRGRVICLSARPEVIFARVRDQTQRPLLHVADPQQRIRELLEARLPQYQQADAVVDTSDITPAETAREVVRLALDTRQ